MKKILLLSMLCLQLITAKAQFVTIPDANFVTELTQLFPSCMSGNQLNTNCPALLSDTVLNISYSSIANLSGIEHFVNLKVLNCSHNQLSSLGTLPSSLEELYCNHNNLATLPILPDSLQIINCSSNVINAITTLPSNLKTLNCVYNQLSNLPALPVSLISLNCDQNQIVSLPLLPNTLKKLGCGLNNLTNLPAMLPSTLEYLDCSLNDIQSLPQLPVTLDTLHCNNDQLNALPQLPAGLIFLSCNGNNLTSLPALPSSLIMLQTSNNNLNALPPLPNSLTRLNCDHNHLSIIPTLPSTLIQLAAHYNYLASLPLLPNGLQVLSCGDNFLSSLPQLPNSLLTLNCENNILTSLPLLPMSINWLYCGSNLLTSLPPCPISMQRFNIEYNNISCLSHLPQVTGGTSSYYGNISNNPLTCVPNQTFYSGALSLCLDNDTLNNPNGCPSVNIMGNVFTDSNNNCTYNASDSPVNNVPVRLLDLQNNLIEQSYSVNGIYSFSNLIPGTYKIEVEDYTLPFQVICGVPVIQNVNLNSINQTISGINFPVVCEEGYDLDIHSVNTQGVIFPGQIFTLRTNITNNETWYNLDCDTSIFSGTVNFTITGPATYIGPANGALTPQIAGNVLTYNISDFNTLSPHSFDLKFMTDTNAQVFDQICAQIEIIPTPMDSIVSNNTRNICSTVANSLDPNMKEVYPLNVLPGYDDWFTYTIHFQNTGNAPAFNIKLIDTLDTNLDLSTFEMLGYSHPAVTTLTGNILTVRFNNIILPDSASNYDGSMGYFQYRLKPLPNLPNGTQIENTAYIYFDYNAPVVTNTTQNNFDITVGKIEPIATKNEFILYPNPSNGIFNFKDTKNIKQVEVYNLLGEQILAQGSQKQINLSGFAKGIYYARINGEVVVKLMKE